MYKILALNCLISAYALSVQYLGDINYRDYQDTITGILMSVCLCISRANAKGRFIQTRLLFPLFAHYLSHPVEKLSCERPLGNIFNFYVPHSISLQFAIHIVSVVYIANLSKANEECVPFIVICQIANRMSVSRRGLIDLEAKFEPNLLNCNLFDWLVATGLRFRTQFPGMLST